MNIKINDQRQVCSIKEEFNSVFPYLKLEFFSKTHKPGCPTAKEFINLNRKTLGECRSVHESGEIFITPAMSVLELEQRFNKVYGLGVQVFRKSGKAWLETTLTDEWSLEKQNFQGEDLSKTVFS